MGTGELNPRWEGDGPQSGNVFLTVIDCLSYVFYRGIVEELGFPNPQTTSPGHICFSTDAELKLKRDQD